jgi:hypothetical protein
MKYKYLIGLFFLFSVGYCNLVNHFNQQKKLVTDLHLKMRGVIVSKELVPNCKGYGVVKVKVLDSNIEYYNPAIPPYYCKINATDAHFFAQVTNVNVKAQLGDTVFVDTDSSRVYTINGEFSFGTDLIQYDPFWKKIKGKF